MKKIVQEIRKKVDGIVNEWEAVGTRCWGGKRVERYYIVYDRCRDLWAAVALGTRDQAVLLQLYSRSCTLAESLHNISRKSVVVWSFFQGSPARVDRWSSQG